MTIREVTVLRVIGTAVVLAAAGWVIVDSRIVHRQNDLSIVERGEYRDAIVVLNAKVGRLEFDVAALKAAR